MKTIISLLASGAFVAIAAAGCDQASPNSLTGQADLDYWNTSQAASHNPAPSHMQQIVGSGQNGITDPATKVIEDAQLGTPDQVARMHGTQKIQYLMLGSFLADLGVTMTAPASNGNGNGSGGGSSGSSSTTSVPTVGELYVEGSAALGAPIYPSRTPEMIIPSTSALAKEFDIFMAAAPEIMANIGKSERCPDVVLVTAGELTEDGITCLIGKPALPDHVALAQQIVASASDPTTGQEIAIATLLAAAHISE